MRACWFALFILCWPAPTEAQASRPLADAVHVEPGATCLSAESLVPQVEAWLGAATVDSELSVSVIGSAHDPRDLTMEIRRAGQNLGKRRFQPAPFVCTQLEASLALAIAMGLKASLRDELLDSLGGPPRMQRRGALGMMLRVGSGLLPRTSYGAGFSGVHTFGDRIALRAEASVDGAGGATFDTAPGKFSTLLLSGQLSACALFPFSRGWAARACLGLALGALEARGQGYNEVYTEWVAWLAAANSVALSMQLTQNWWLEVPGSLVIPLNDVSFGVAAAAGGLAATRSLPTLGFTVGAGPSYHF